MPATFQAGSFCTSDAATALQFIAGRVSGSVVAVGSGTSAVVQAEPVSDGSSIVYTFHPVDGAATWQQSVPIVPPPCGKLEQSDAFPIVLAIFAGWIAIAAARWILRAKDDT